MRLDEIRTLIMNSDRDQDWHDVAVGSYFKDVPIEDAFEWHGSLIVYRHNVDLTIQWGMRSRHMHDVTKAEELWHDNGAFPNPAATVVHADVFWAGSLVDRVYLAYVDGHRALLPVGEQRALNFDAHAPRPQKIEWEYSATRWEVGLARILDNGRDFDSYFRRVGFVIAD